MSRYTESGIQFNIKNNTVDSNNNSKYIIDNKDEIILPKKIVNAIDIDWNEATLPGSIVPIKSTADLLKRLSYAVSSKESNFVYRNNLWTIGQDGYWYENGIKSDYKAVPENAHVWTIGQDGYWYENGVKTNNKSIADQQWTIGEDGYWYNNGVKSEYKANGYDGPKMIIIDSEEYDALDNYEENALYFILGDPIVPEPEEPEPEPESYTNITTNLHVNENLYTEDGTITLEPSQTYTISGTLKGNIVIDATDPQYATAITNKTFNYTNIIFDNVKIVSESDFGIKYIIPDNGKGYKGLNITINKNTFNLVACLESHERGEDQPGAIYSMNNLNIQGAGYLAIQNLGGHGIRGQETNISNLHLYCDAIHDGVHGKNIKVIGGTYYFDNCNDCFGTSSQGNIIYFAGEIRYSDINNVEGKIFNSKQYGLYMNANLLTQTQLNKCTGMHLASNESLRTYWGLDFIEDNNDVYIYSYDNAQDYKNLTNGTLIFKYDSENDRYLKLSGMTYEEWTPESILTKESNVERFNMLEITQPYISITGYLPFPLYFGSSVFGASQDAYVKLNNAYIKNNENIHTLYYNGANDKGRLKIKISADTFNIIENSYYDNISESFHCDSVKSESNLTVEANDGSYVYITSKMNDGLDGGDISISDTKGTVVISNCGQRGIKGNAIVIGPKAAITQSVIGTYDNTVVLEGLCYVKNNCQEFAACNVQGSTEEEIKTNNTGMADIFCRNGKASKGQFGTTNAGLVGYLIIGSLGAVVSANLGNATNLYYNSTYCKDNGATDPSTGEPITPSITITNDPGISNESVFAKTLLNTNIDY